METVCRLNVVYVVTVLVTGEAYRVVQHMLPDDRLDLAAIKEWLKEAYEVNAFDAYKLMKARTWKTGESIDGYASSLAR